LIPAVGRSMCHLLISHCDLYSNSTGKCLPIYQLVGCHTDGGFVGRTICP
jgi:hypothetical protein